MPSMWSHSSVSGLLVTIPERERLSRYSWLFDIVRIEDSITGRILGPVLTCTLFATTIAVIDIVQGYNLSLTNNVVPLLSVVVGLILVFRNGTSYDRWYEGSKDWETSLSHVRNLSRQLWVSVTVPPKTAPVKAGVTRSKANSTEPLTASSVREHKIKALNLLSAYLFAVKHHLRNEVGIHYDDMAGLLPESFAKYDNASSMTPEHAGRLDSPLTSGQESPVVARIRGGSNYQSITDQHTPLLAKDRRHTIHFHPYAPPSQPSLPLLIAHELTRIVHKFRAQGCLDTIGPAGANTINGLIQSMVNQLAKMERVSNTPIPAAYGIHLKQCVTLYLFTLPFTLVADLGWFMIPVVTVVSFTLMGIEGIADEIEMPFGTDYYDLPLDRLCMDVRAEIEYMIESLPEGSDEWEE